ncbi:MAG: DUF1572 domain-containing protein [Bryobacteraceae bacterium]|nr:DUF1572 domain-containing protein [Bryobacteraceae bacterium]
MVNHLLVLFARDLQALATEVQQYPSDDALWILPPGIANSGGNLVLHLCGNLRHYIGFRLSGISYQRDRPAEFSHRGLTRAELLAGIELAQTAVASLASLEPARLEEIYPEEVLGKPMTTGFFLIHLYGHLRYHLGQVNYHRRLTGV